MDNIFDPYPIESNIPVPKSHMRHGFLDRARAMKVGDSIRFEDLNKAQSFRRMIYDLGRKASIRKIDGAYRVWRVEGESTVRRT